MVTETQQKPTRFLRLREVEHRTGRKKSAIYADMAEGRFPKPVRIGSKAVAWIEAEVDAWIAERISASRSAA
jgi:prophage regulatory protein